MKNRIVPAFVQVLLIFATTVTGCGKDADVVSGAVAQVSEDKLVPPKAREEVRRALRKRTDTARSRLWVLGLDKVRVYGTANRRLMRAIALPNWSVARFICPPDLVLDGSGSAIITSNVQAKLWRIDANTFSGTELHIRLQEKQQLDVGFGALALVADGTLLGLSSPWRALWHIDTTNGSAQIVDLGASSTSACELSTQLLGEFERSRKP